MFERKKYRLSQSVTALLLALLLVIAAMPLTPALAQVAEGTEAAQEGTEALRLPRRIQKRLFRQRKTPRRP